VADGTAGEGALRDVEKARVERIKSLARYAQRA
jgi:hypothetical protein